MPELPEVETVRRSLLPVLVGRRIERVLVRERRLRRQVDPALLKREVCGQVVVDLSRRGKYLLIHLEGERRLLVHLGMSGRLFLTRAATPSARHEHVVFSLDDGQELRFRDPRRFGVVEATTVSALATDRRLSELGVEPLSRACSAKYLYERSRGLRRPVKNFLMDARVLVGVGNIYANEALFLARIHPLRAAGRSGLARWERLTAAVKQVLRDAIRQGGTTLNDFRSGTGEEGYFQVFLRVYQREGEGCPECERPIRKTVLAGRSTFYCPSCQR
jgi:formamidopyrimidine-DNA glycosylase